MNEEGKELKIVGLGKFCLYFLLWWLLWGAITQVVILVLSEIIFGVTKSINIPIVRVIGIILSFLISLKLTCDALELTVNSLFKRKIFTYQQNIKKVLIISITILAIMNLTSFLPKIVKTEININNIKSNQSIEEIDFTNFFAISYYQKQENLNFEQAKEKVINTSRQNYLVTSLTSVAMLIGNFFIVFVFEKKFLAKICLDEKNLIGDVE